MTYSQFLAIFLVIPIAVLLYVLRPVRPATFGLLAAVAVIAIVYTAPWDSLMVLNGVWTWQPGRIFGVTIFAVPIEEYAFFVLQTFATGLFTLLLLRRR